MNSINGYLQSTNQLNSSKSYGLSENNASIITRHLLRLLNYLFKYNLIIRDFNQNQLGFLTSNSKWSTVRLTDFTCLEKISGTVEQMARAKRNCIGKMLDIVWDLLYRDSEKYTRLTSSDCMTFFKLARNSFVNGNQPLERIHLLESHNFLKNVQSGEAGELIMKTERMAKKQMKPSEEMKETVVSKTQLARVSSNQQNLSSSASNTNLNSSPSSSNISMNSTPLGFSLGKPKESSLVRRRKKEKDDENAQ